MAIHISKMHIAAYRGIKDLAVDNLGDINIITGNNNSGKTSFLEVIQILSRPDDFDNIVMVSRQRERFRMMTEAYTQSLYHSFLNMFNKTQSDLDIAMNCTIGESTWSVSLAGEVRKALISEEQINELKKFDRKQTAAIYEEVETFLGKLIVKSDVPILQEMSDDVLFNKYSRIVINTKARDIFPLDFISPIDHIINDFWGEITRNEALTSAVVELLQSSFDAGIQDLRTIEEDYGSIVRMIDHKDLGRMPLSTYGDGIKKVISLVKGAAAMRDGVLLIDEFETSIHTKAMKQVFDFVIKICKERNIQLFLTTHSEETIDKLLRFEGEAGSIRLITLLKNADNTTARVLTGIEALSAKNELGLELR